MPENLPENGQRYVIPATLGDPGNLRGPRQPYVTAATLGWAAERLPVRSCWGAGGAPWRRAGEAGVRAVESSGRRADADAGLPRCLHLGDVDAWCLIPQFVEGIEVAGLALENVDRYVAVVEQ